MTTISFIPKNVIHSRTQNPSVYFTHTSCFILKTIRLFFSSHFLFKSLYYSYKYYITLTYIRVPKPQVRTSGIVTSDARVKGKGFTESRGEYTHASCVPKNKQMKLRLIFFEGLKLVLQLKEKVAGIDPNLIRSFFVVPVIFRFR